MSRNVALKNLAVRYTIKHTVDTRLLCVTRKSVIPLLDPFEEKNISKYEIPTIFVFSCRFHFIIIVIIITIIIPWFVRVRVRARVHTLVFQCYSLFCTRPVHSPTLTLPHTSTVVLYVVPYIMHATHELVSNSFTINVYFTVRVALPWACI